MSTVPGDDALRDAGLTRPDLEDTINLAEEVTGGEGALGDDLEEYHPGTPRPDLSDEADEADVVEQAWAVPEGDDEARQ
ncbi:hypothetical protein SAMN05216410_1896 [Sanguibacter gelidistatuariae]|uniref:Uncharacterized protein n=1 Tax=Sanguibacter gelidistatuariae TaxID=1814289 RepID=A0A1G6MJH4_9MICO|nr:hypothetical protein [Sanguibacter gelidistatuariae]SDC55683.1 hypothetical protein SAMN05216410_1896 [Sanguibacter gelidistatuariae]